MSLLTPCRVKVPNEGSDSENYSQQVEPRAGSGMKNADNERARACPLPGFSLHDQHIFGQCPFIEVRVTGKIRSFLFDRIAK